MRSLNPLMALDDAQIEQYRRAAEDLLETTGFRVHHEGLLRRAQAAGAPIDPFEGRVRLPAPLLRELLAQAPDRYAIRNALGDSIEIGDGAPRVFAITNDPWIVDYKTQHVRHPRLADVRRHTAIAQRLDCVACMSCMDYPVTDVPGEASSLRALEAHLLLHAKHNVALPASIERFRLWLEIAAILNRGGDVVGSRLLTVGVPVLSPLTLTRANAELLLAACAHDFPVAPTICPMAGTTAPHSLAATLLLAYGENLFMAAMTQLIRPGNPFLYAMGPSISDMRAGENRYYTCDKVLWKTAGVQLAKACGLPCAAECGGAMSHRCDAQTGAEGILFMLAAHASGADVLAGLGSCYNANGLSAEMMLIQETWLRVSAFLRDGISTDPILMGLDNIKEAGPGAHFLTDPLTLAYARGGAFFDPGLLDYSGGYREELSLLERAHARANALEADAVSPLPEDIQDALRRWFHDQYRRLA